MQQQASCRNPRTKLQVNKEEDRENGRGDVQSFYDLLSKNEQIQLRHETGEVKLL